ncbi:MAG: hybrid sensor histidine kinase/response regulator, partial [Kamptonema sp. SIO4C4]|nr:hybrid sensor histidine kinase/response regulator [Kamptonema sp. SIO4C4]
MYIEDDELRTLFQSASEEHLQKLESGLLQLEKQPDDADCLEELLREAHSLKGDARMLGVNDVEKMTHQIEHILGTISRQETQLTPELSDRLYQGLDIIHQLVQEAVTGEPSGVDAFHALTNLMGATPSEDPTPNTASDPPEATETPDETPNVTDSSSETPEPTKPIEITSEAVIDTSESPNEDEAEDEPPEEDPDATEIQLPHSSQPSEAQTVTISTPTTKASSQGEPYRIHTIRVETRYLDDLITQSGELTVTKIRIAHVANEIDTLYDLWEEAKNSNNHNGNGQITSSLSEQIEDLLDQLKLSAQENASRLDLIAGNLESRIRTLRLLPLSNIFQLFPRMVRDLSRQENKTVELIIEGGDTTADKRILEEMK